MKLNFTTGLAGASAVIAGGVTLMAGAAALPVSLVTVGSFLFTKFASALAYDEQLRVVEGQSSKNAKREARLTAAGTAIAVTSLASCMGVLAFGEKHPSQWLNENKTDISIPAGQRPAPVPAVKYTDLVA